MTTRPSRGSRSPFLLAILMLASTLGGVLLGSRWHEEVDAVLPALAGNPSPVLSANPGQLWTCSMHPQVIQDKPGVCPICHMQLTPLHVDSGAGTGGSGSTAPFADQQTKERRIKYWWDPMTSPPYISDKPGKSPLGMDLVPVYEDESSPSAAGVVTIDPAVVQNLGVRTATATEGPLVRSVRAVGYLNEAEPLARDINLRVSGWVRRLYAATEGQHVEAGDPLFDLYSPEIQVAIEELIAARRARSSAPGSPGAAPSAADQLYDAATRKLGYFGLDRAQVAALSGLDRAPEAVTFTSPVTGDVTEKPVVEGAAVKAGDRVLRIVDHTTLWLDARVFEKDLALVRTGQRGQVAIPSSPGTTLSGEVVFIHPALDPTTRTALVRISIPNPDLSLKPGMYATVRLQSPIADRAVLVPREAVIDTGDSQVAFVALGQGRFEPRNVTVGAAGDGGMVQVIEGLAPGEEVVTSGQFLLDAESRLREAVRAFLGQRERQAPAGERDSAAAGSAHPPGAPMGAPLPASEGQGVADRQAAVDRLVSAYLDLAAALGAEQTNSDPLDTSAFSAAATSLRAALAGSNEEPLLAAVEEAAESMDVRTIDTQREAFKAVSQRVIALVEALPPSRTVAERLYLMDCPMAPGNWLQRTPDIANPFYGSEMKRCGSVLRTITPAEGAR